MSLKKLKSSADLRGKSGSQVVILCWLVAVSDPSHITLVCFTIYLKANANVA